MNDVDRVRTFYEREGALFDAFHPLVEWHEMEGVAYGGVYTGVRAVAEGVFDHIRDDWEDFRAVPEAVFAAEGGRVVSVGRYRGRFRPTGREIAARFAHVYTLDAGKVVRFEQFTDSALYNRAMGRG